ncbi:hypothetical protein [Methanogenium organophilum]|uniref:Uncharacterized protein n=1 Tax=Methanogenium organophilum TaxID=2199 RepID=A0A9X9S6V5_METOG|nr:hypothetical protein [Methanogenium organophilum]WAI02488.1 hypothetical protein OU421_06330 [Methanogenium organophilum]
MIINTQRRRTYLLVALPISLLVAWVFTAVAPVFKIHPPSFALTVAVEFLCGLFLAVAVGMIFNEDSRINGIVYAGIFAALPVFYVMTSPWANVDLLTLTYTAGIVCGGAFVIRVVTTNRYDHLARGAKGLFTIFFALIIGFLAYEMYISAFTPDATVSEAYAAQYIFFFGTGIVLSVVLYWLTIRITVGVRASEIFIFGPRSSGKTYFVLGLWSYISQHFEKGHSNEGVVLSGDPTDTGDDLRISNMYAKILDGKILSRTYRYQMVMYQLTGMKYGIIPVKWTVVDYAGEYYDELNEETFRRAVALIGEWTGIPTADIRRRAGTIEFVRFIRETYPEALTDPAFTRSVIITTMYGNFLRAGKVIFLIDGEKVTDDRKGHAQLAREFGGYMKTLIDLEGGRYLGLFRPNKKFALVVTKADLVCWKNREIRNLLRTMNVAKLSEVPETSKEALTIETRLYEILGTNQVFRNLVNMMNDISMYFVAVSVDATAEPFPTEEGFEEEIWPASLAPWRFTEIFRFGL